MKNKNKKRVKWVVLVFILGIIAGGIYFYFYHLKKEKTPVPVEKSLIKEKLPPTVEKEPQPLEEEVSDPEQIDEPEIADRKDPCLEVEAMVREFFLFMNKQDYMQRISPEMDSYEIFLRMIKKLSQDPPSPAGEGLDPRLMFKNIFYFFRLLDDTELRIIKEFLKHEAETLEMNLAVFYQWFTLAEECPDSDMIRPSLTVAYASSGFFTNTIGGRAYLFRRSNLLRQLVTYYALLTIHEADKRGENTSGLDIFPELRPLIKEIERNPDLRLKQSYLAQLQELLDYYQVRR